MLKILAVAGLLISIIFSSDRPEVETAKPSRGIGRLKLSQLTGLSGAMQQAAQKAKAARRAAVLPFAAGAKDLHADAVGLMLELHSDLHYVPALVAVSSDSVLQVAPLHPTQPWTPETFKGLGKKLGASLLVVGGLAGDESKLEATAELWDVSGANPKRVATSRAEGAPSEFFTLADKLLEDLLAGAKIAPAEKSLREMKKAPTKNQEARRHCDQCQTILLNVKRAAGADPAAAVGRARDHAQAAVKLDANYLRAYSLAASCAHFTRASNALATALGQGKAKKSQAVDQLAMLEIDGDYARFQENNPEKAREKYRAMLEINPTHYGALTSLIDTYLTSQDVLQLAESDQADVTLYVATLLTAHPQSPIATLLNASAGRRQKSPTTK